MLSCSEPEPAFDDGGPGVALVAIVAGRADGAGSLLSQTAVGAITVTKAAAIAGMTTRRSRRDRSASADATWSGARCESAVTAVTAMLWLFEIADCSGVKEPPRGNTAEVSSLAPTSTSRFEMLVTGTFASWSRNLAAVGRSTGSLLRAFISTSIKYRLTPGIGKYRFALDIESIGVLATSTVSSRATGAVPTLCGGRPANRAYN